MKFNTSDATIFQFLCKNESINLYQIHEETKITPADLFFSAVRLAELDMLYIRREELIRSKNFKELALKYRWDFVNRPKRWKAVFLDEPGELTEGDNNASLDST
ncbi:hypothetical protein [Oricola cellulosilytica]|uniref:Uncharacterized protein n=1 Tax=Oricola cellulosilytica TaxID=1429082 RepID=A0A4R0PCW2_9HYPH|nr:hypothetical protein [Oricola cellulosilytica]TCD15312.1 hypothetical protein E0D97_07190 [Oricola cellulosilytica]